MTPKELSKARTSNDRVRRGPVLSGRQAAEVVDILLDKIEEFIAAHAAERTRAEQAESRVEELESDIVQHVNGANAPPRHFNAGPQVHPITSDVQDGRWVNAVMKSRWNGEAWDAVGMVNGWIGPFEGELPDCVADKFRGIDYGHIPELTPTPPESEGTS